MHVLCYSLNWTYIKRCYNKNDEFNRLVIARTYRCERYYTWYYSEKERNTIDFQMIIKDCNCYHFFESIHSHACTLSSPYREWFVWHFNYSMLVIFHCSRSRIFEIHGRFDTNGRIVESRRRFVQLKLYKGGANAAMAHPWYRAIEIFNQHRYIDAHDRKQSSVSIVNHRDKFRVNDERGNLSIVCSFRTREYVFSGWLNENLRIHAIKSIRYNRFLARGNASTAFLLRIYERSVHPINSSSSFSFLWWLDETRDNLLQVIAFFEFILDRDSIQYSISWFVEFYGKQRDLVIVSLNFPIYFSWNIRIRSIHSMKCLFENVDI